MARWVELEDTCPRCRFVIFRRMRLNGEKEAKPESCASDCSADGRRIKQGEASVQPAGPEQIPLVARLNLMNRLDKWKEMLVDADYDNVDIIKQVISEYQSLLDAIEGEAGGGQDDRSRPAG